MLQRMILAAKLDVDFYEMVEADASYLKESFLVVLLVSVLGNVGMMLAYDDAWTRLVSGFLATLFSWVAWSGITLWIGTTITRGPETESDMGEMLRVLGYAHTPQAFIIFAFIPGVGSFIAAIAAFWSLLAGIVAIRQALDFTTTRALLTVFVGWLIVWLLRVLILAVF